jgi:membrane-anchored protein YejM (alkaline phosphatase superfamily)
MFLTGFVTYTYEHFVMNSRPLLAADAVPLYIKGTSGSLYKKLGFKQPDRDAVRIKMAQAASLQNYPQQPIKRNPDRPKYNVVWIACESWAAKLFSSEIMPKTAEFAEKGVLFTRHFSGGNVTRQGVFSMFYALPGNYWHAFLAARRGPVFIDWLKEDGYRFKCITSSKFTYPEFDQTVFFQVAHEDLHSDAKGKTYERDQRNVKLLIRSIEEGADSGQPFFSFMFFESTHNPYEFPAEAEFTRDYIHPFNAAQVSPDSLGRVLLTKGLLDFAKIEPDPEGNRNVVIVGCGDFGEIWSEELYNKHVGEMDIDAIRRALEESGL